MPAPYGNLNNNKYQPEYAQQAYKICLLGARDRDLADFFEVHRDTIHHWGKLHPEFEQAKRNGKMKADAEVAYCLFQRAVGTTIKKQRVTLKGEVIDTVEELPADVRAMEFWLKCRNRQNWNPKQHIQLSGDAHHPLAFLLEEVEKEAEESSALPR
ncbi:hypothetical protein [Enterovibrio norvegicus]|uniref:hypothetical protein n=1 Tax=Enterovibrio norvegicus TaxID=188144 RepID=UPI000C852837|nr:hypothetical protein [Enterovibrio norvegicus]PMN73760.1 hypothetical protein BCT27_01760 [Enterovibrio norvegicus]